MNQNLEKALELGQSIWYDSISRSAIRGGELENLRNEGVRGVTTNPSIFQKALSGTNDYDEDIKALIKEGKDDTEIYDALTINEVCEACAIFRPIFDESKGTDGFVSLEVNPLIADDAETTVSEALRLWKALKCPNAMIKIPATEAGVKALEEVVAAGANVNATLIFSIEQYVAAAEAYIRAIERRAAAGLTLNQASVASAFVSRLDTAIDPVLAEKAPELAGHIAIANTRAMYAKFKELFSSDLWKVLEAKGAKVQRPLWASTSVKNKAYSPTLYTDELIGKDTVNTLPPATLKVFMESGTAADTVSKPGFAEELAALPAAGIDLAAVNAKLLENGLASFAQSFRDMMAIIANKRKELA